MPFKFEYGNTLKNVVSKKYYIDVSRSNIYEKGGCTYIYLFMIRRRNAINRGRHGGMSSSMKKAPRKPYIVASFVKGLGHKIGSMLGEGPTG